MRILSTAMLVALVGCAAQPDSTSPASQAAALGTPTGEQTPAANAPRPADKPKEFKPPAGYKKRLKAGQVVYCSKIVVLGSRFPKDDCRTQAELEDLEARNQTMRDDMGQQRSICSSAEGCASF